MARNYRSEYARETGERKAKRAARNRARYSLMKQGRVKKGDGKDVDHKNRNAMDNRPSNLRAMSRAANLARKRK
jgi:hypothetical protein|tara:strand:+ start:304 stop:525 length:222 start_codon:yes stop_codon:yes gene_type:complete